MLFINKRRLKQILLIIAVAILFDLLIIGLGILEAILVNRYFPDPKNYPWQYRYNMYPSFSVPKEGYAVYVDLDTLQLTLYNNGEVFKQWPVSGGAKETPSPLGLYHVNGIGNWGEGFGGSWISINVLWGKYGIHGTYEPWTIGRYNSSHGCIRMLNGDVRELKKYVRWGTPVFIKYDNCPFRAMRHGDIGSDVLELQENLQHLGYYQWNPDGKFGDVTMQAVKKFQRDHGLKADGVVGWGTHNKLLTLLD